MIKDFETGHHVRIKKAKRKKTAGEKRIIASRVAAYCVAASILSFTPAIIAGYDYSQDLRALDKEQKELYQLFMESGEYSQQIDNQLYQLADDYICGEIDYKTFRKRLNKMFTEETAKELLEISANEALKAQVAEIENQKQQRTEEFNSSAAITATMVGAAVGSAAAIASGAASIGYHIKENNEEKRKRKQEQNWNKPMRSSGNTGTPILL